MSLTERREERPAFGRDAGPGGWSRGLGRAGAPPAGRVVPWGGTGGTDAVQLIHCERGSPSAGSPSLPLPPLSSPPGIHLSPPGPESLRDLRAREGGRRLEEKRKLFNDYFLLGRCMPESSASWPLSLSFLFLESGRDIYFLVSERETAPPHHSPREMGRMAGGGGSRK